MRKAPLLLLWSFPAVALAAEEGGVRFSDVALWGLFLTLLLALALVAVRARGWADLYIAPAMRAFQRAASPPRLHAWVPGGGAPPALFGENWLKPGGVHWVRGVAADVAPRVVADLLASPWVAVAVHGHVAEVSLDQALADQADRVGGRLFVSPDPIAEVTLAALSLAGSPAVLVVDEAPDADQVASVARWSAILVVVNPDEPPETGLVGVRRAP